MGYEGGILGKHWIKLFVMTYGCGLVTATTVWAQQFEVFEHIVLSQEVTVSAHRLCQDGLFIYFKDKTECQNTPVPFQCEQGLRVAPIRSVEKIYLDVGGPSVTRFYEVDTSFSYKKFLKSEVGPDQLLESGRRQIPECNDREIYEPANVGEWRYVETELERVMLESMLYAGHKLINTPHGPIERIRNLDWSYFERPDQPWIHVRTPFCNENLSTSMIWQMSGEHTGNGVVDFAVGPLQSLSVPMYIERVREVWDPQTQQVKKIYDFTCQPVWTI
jgi:hypothetical protein